MKEENNKQKHYLIYQITNLVNGKIYIGKHETTNIEDNYFGSGNLIVAAINKYGLENFEFKILIDLKNREEMNLLEKMVVTEEFCARPDTYNIKVGGDGGWDYINNALHLNGNKMFVKNMSKDDFKKRSIKAQQTYANRRKTFTVEELKAYKDMKRRVALCGFSQAFKGKHHTDEAKQKMKDFHAKNHPQAGEKNSQYGMIAIYNEETFERATQPKDQPIPKGWAKGRFYNATPEELKERKKLVEEILKLDPNSKVTILMKKEQLLVILERSHNSIGTPC